MLEEQPLVVCRLITTFFCCFLANGGRKLTYLLDEFRIIGAGSLSRLVDWMPPLKATRCLYGRWSPTARSSFGSIRQCHLRTCVLLLEPFRIEFSSGTCCSDFKANVTWKSQLWWVVAFFKQIAGWENGRFQASCHSCWLIHSEKNPAMIFLMDSIDYSTPPFNAEKPGRRFVKYSPN